LGFFNIVRHLTPADVWVAKKVPECDAELAGWWNKDALYNATNRLISDVHRKNFGVVKMKDYPNAIEMPVKPHGESARYGLLCLDYGEFVVIREAGDNRHVAVLDYE
jgi:hypothetical protein